MSIEDWLLFLRIAEHFVQDEGCLKRTAKCACSCFSIVLCHEINCKSIIFFVFFLSQLLRAVNIEEKVIPKTRSQQVTPSASTL